MPDLDRRPLHFTLAALTSKFIARANSTTDIVQPVTMPFSRRCHTDCCVTGESQTKTAVIVLYQFFDLLWDVVSCQSRCYHLMRDGSIGIGKVKQNE